MKSKTDAEFYASFSPTTIRAAPQFEVGNKVFISDHTHPAAGETGRVTTAPREVNGIVRGVWAEVEIDGWAGHKCGVQPHQMRKLR